MPARLTPVDGGAAFRLEKPIVLIGRHEDCDLSLPEHVKISRRHCCVARVDDRYVIRDLGSMNGVRVNGERVTEAVLQPGCKLAIADTLFVFEDGVPLTGNEPAIPQRTANMTSERMSNPSGDVVLVSSHPGLDKRGVADAAAQDGPSPPLPARCEFESEHGGRGLSEDVLLTPRMVELSARDEFGPAPLSNPPNNDSQSGLRFVGA